MSDIREELQKLVDKFNKTENEKKEKIKDLERSIAIVFEDDGKYHTYLKNGELSDIEEGEINADITVITTTDTFLKILNKEEDALTAYITKKIKIKAKLMDKLLLNDILS